MTPLVIVVGIVVVAAVASMGGPARCVQLVNRDQLTAHVKIAGDRFDPYSSTDLPLMVVGYPGLWSPQEARDALCQVKESGWSILIAPDWLLAEWRSRPVVTGAWAITSKGDASFISWSDLMALGK